MNGREAAPFEIRYPNGRGRETLLADAVIDSTDRVVLIEDGVIKLEIDVPIERPRRRGSSQVAALEQRILRYLFTDGGYLERSGGWASGAAALSRVK